jgi:uncharacterized protein
VQALKSVVSTSEADGATIVTQTKPIAGQEDTFRDWQEKIGIEIAKWPSFVEQKILPPSPPGQLDWVILQRFSSIDAATGWLRSTERLTLVEGIQSILAGTDGIHIIKDSNAKAPAEAASVVISTRVRPGQESAYRRWEQRISAIQSRSPGFQGYRLEPPISGVQDDWLAIIRFDSERNLQNWLESPERLKLLKESEPFTDHLDTRIVRSGFDQWFSASKQGGQPAPAWKQNMIVLSLLYPVVFLFGAFVQQPLLTARLKMPFWLALFVGNVVSILLLNMLVPWTSNRFAWWLSPSGTETARITWTGIGILALLYLGWLFVFSLM